MAKSPADELTAPEAPAPEVKLSLSDFCARLSETVRRPELIGAFESVEKSAGSAWAAESVFRERFDAFANKQI